MKTRVNGIRTVPTEDEARRVIEDYLRGGATCSEESYTTETVSR